MSIKEKFSKASLIPIVGIMLLSGTPVNAQEVSPQADDLYVITQAEASYTKSIIESISSSSSPSDSYNELSESDKKLVDSYTAVNYVEESFIPPVPTSDLSPQRMLGGRLSTPAVTLPFCRTAAATVDAYNVIGVRLGTVTVEGKWCEHRGKVVSAEVINHYASSSPGLTHHFSSSAAHVSDAVRTKRASMVANYSFSVVWKGILNQNLCSRLHGYINGVTTQDKSCSAIH